MTLMLLWRSAMVLVSIIYSTSSATSHNRQLFFGLLGHQENSRAQRGVEDALDVINNRTDILLGYALRSTYMPTELQGECSREAALQEFFGQMNSSRQILALIGLGCSLATEAIAEISQYYSLILLSCVSSSDELSDRVRFPYYFQLLPSEINLARVFYSIIKEYGWRRVALIVQNEHRFRATMKNLKVLLSSNGVNYTEAVFDTEDGYSDVYEDLLDYQTRIFVIATDSKHARLLTCMAHKLGIKYPKYAFLTYGTYEPQWWITQRGEGIEDSNECRPEEIAEVLEFSLAALHFPSESLSVTKNSSHKMVPEQDEVIQTFVDGQSRHSNAYYTELKFYHQCYDATLALAFALNRTIEGIPIISQCHEETVENNYRSISELGNNETNRHAKDQAEIHSENFEIGDFNFAVDVVAKLMKKHMEDTNFIGLSGPVQFDNNGIRNATELRVLQYRTAYFDGTPITINTSRTATLDQRLRLIDVAYVGEDGSSLEFLYGNIWPNGTVPYDGSPVSKTAAVAVPVSVIFVLLDVCGIAFALVCLVFNILNRDKKLIRLSSPNLNYLMITGTLLMYCSGIAFLIPTGSPSVVLGLCFIRMWLLIYGYSCGFGTIAAKLWRVYYIFRNPQTTKRKNSLQDWHLNLFVLVLVTVNASFMFLHILLEGTIAKFKVRAVPNKEKPLTQEGNLGILTEYSIYECSSHPWIRYSILATVYSCLGFLHICALYFAFQTRKVKVKGLNDAKYIAMIAYITTIVLLVTLATSFALSHYINIYAVLNSLGIWISATVILGFMFIPKMVRLYKDPNGETVFTAHEEGLQVTAALGGGPQVQSQVGEGDMESLKKKIQLLEAIVLEYKRMTGVDVTKKWLILSDNMNGHNDDCANNGTEEGSRIAQTSKVSFGLGCTNPALEDCPSD